MKRKIIQLSASTKVISLPSDWIRKNNLKKGAELEVTEKDNMIIVSRENSLSKKEAKLDISNMDAELIWIILDGLYISGFEDISLQTGTQKQKDTLTKASKFFPGLIIYEEKKDFVRLKNISIQEDFDLTQIISRIRNMTLAMMDDSLEAVNEKEWDILLNIKKRDYTLNTYVSLAFRHINKYGYSPISRQGTISQYVKFLEIFSDRLCVLLEEIGKRKEISKQQMEIMLKIRDLYRWESGLISKFSLDKLSEFDIKRKELLKAVESEKSKNKTNRDLDELVQIFFEMEEMAVQLNM